jgi:predicted RNA binding protein YcfA (HicA-like mRNA interferase family)
MPTAMALLIMANVEKIIDRIRTRPTPTNIKWDELVLVLKHLGYRMLNNDGSRRRFHHEHLDHVICLHRPHPGNEVKAAYIRLVRDTWENMGMIPWEKTK